MLKGDFAGLVELQKRMRVLGNEKTRMSFARVMGAEAVSLVQRGFRDGVDPYGASWAPLKHRNGKPLLDTGRMRSSFSAQPTGKGFELGTNVTYAKFHQYGTGGRKKASTQRRFVNKRGRFISAAKAAKVNARATGSANWAAKLHASGLAGTDAVVRRMLRGALGRSHSASFKFLHFAAGGGAIPARVMVPTGGNLGSAWSKAFEETATRFFSRLMKKK